MEIIRYLKATILYNTDRFNNKKRAEKATELMLSMLDDPKVQATLHEAIKAPAIKTWWAYAMALRAKNPEVLQKFYALYNV